LLGAVALGAVSLAVVPAGGAIHTLPMASWQANGRVSTIVVQNGVAYLGGQFTAMLSPAGVIVRRNHLAAVQVSTGRLLSWNPDASGNVNVLRVAGGVVYVGGRFSSLGGRPRYNAGAVSATTGAVSRTWGARTDAAVTAMAILGNTVYLGGSFGHVKGIARTRLAAVSTSGVLDQSWRPTADSTVRVLLADSANARIYAGGDFAHVSDVSTPYLAALGTVLGHVHPFAARPTGRVWGLSLSGASLYAAVGGHTPAGEVAAYGLASGKARWSRWFDGDAQTISATATTVYVGGHFLSACADQSGGGTPWVCTNPIPRAKLADLAATNGSVGTWNPGTDSEYGVWTMRTPPSHLLIGGDFKHVDGEHHWHYAQFVR
jgi:hypothetical protein